MRPYALFYFYRRRLRVHMVQELLAGFGIAIAVALVFAALVSERSIAGSAGEVVRAVTGQANLQLRARDGDGVDERLLGRVEHLAGVKQVAPLLEQTATILARNGRRVSVDVAGTDVSLAVLDGLAHTLPLETSQASGGIGISKASADALGSGRFGGQSGATVSLKLRGIDTKVRVSAVLGHEAVGALAGARVAVMPLQRMQRIAGLQRRITRIFVQSAPGVQASVRAELRRIAGPRLEVGPADQDVALLRQALRPSDQASELFAAIGALLGFLLAFNAMLLTVPERRQAIADLRIAGTRRSAIVQMVLFQAICLGVAAAIAGLLVGYLLAVDVFHQSSAYLAEAFTLGGNTIVGVRPALLAVAVGLLATFLASAIPLLDLRRGRARDAVFVEVGAPGNAVGGATQRRLFAGAAGLLALASLLFALDSSTALLVSAVLALATVLAVPLMFAGVLRVLGALAAHSHRLTTLPVALASLRATTLRSLALAATGAVALFGSVALGGARENLLRGIRGFAASYVADAQLWIANPGDNQAVEGFAADHYAARIAQVPGVASVRSFQGGFLQLGSRRVWVLARPPGGSREVLRSQLVDGSQVTANARLSEGGWIALSEQIAKEHHVGIGGVLALATPTGERRFRVAATTTNLAWSPGVIFIGTADFSRTFASATPTALAVDLRSGVDVRRARKAIARALGPSSGLEVSLASEREASINTLTGEGLGQLGEISTLLLIAAIAAMAAALASSIWQRRAWLAGLRLSGARPRRLRRILLAEATLMLGAGCLTGAIAGLYGEVVIDAYLKSVTGFPLASGVTLLRPLGTFALVLALALLIVAIPGWLASRVSPSVALGEQ